MSTNKDREQTKQNTATKDREAEYSQDISNDFVREDIIQDSKSDKNRQANVISKKTSKGKNGESNLKISTFYVHIGQNISAYDVVSTDSENRLHVLIMQGRYKKEYELIGKVKTTTLPVAPIGTKGKIKATDLDTGETLELVWQWERLFSLSSLWKKIKKLFIKEEY